MRKVEHPEFDYCATNCAAPIVFIFRRSEWKEPSAEQLAEYDRNAEIVRAHGGRMWATRDELAGRNEPFTQAEVDAAIKAVKKQHPDLDVYTHWNGAGCYSLSIGASDDGTAK